MDLILGIILILASLFLIVAVLLQSSKSHRLSGTIAGGAETFFGKTKGSTIDKKLSKITTVVAIIFVVLVLVVYLVQDTQDYSGLTNGDTTVNTGDTDHDHDHGDAADTDAADTDAADTDAADTGDAVDSGDAADTDAADTDATDSTDEGADA